MVCIYYLEYLECSPQNSGIISISIDGMMKLKKALDYKYLRSIITSYGSILSDAKAWVKDEVAPAH